MHPDLLSPRSAALKPSRAARLGAAIGVISGFVVTTVLVVGFVVKVPYVIISPGSAVPLDEDIVSASGAPTFGQSGRLLFLTVLESTQDPTVWRWLLAQLDGDVEVFKRAELLGCSTYQEDTLLNQTLMTDSQDAARIAALRHLDLSVVPGPTRVVVMGVDCKSDAVHKLQPGDVITAIDGQPVRAVDDLHALLLTHRPGELVTVTVRRSAQTESVPLRLSSADGEPRLGVFVRNTADYSYAVDVRIDASRVGGPSAGLAFALAIVDELTPGDITGGRRVAITGTIAPDGTVGAVGGVAQKAVVAERVGVRLLIVPKSEAREAREHAGSVRVVGVSTLADALTALDRARSRP